MSTTNVYEENEKLITGLYLKLQSEGIESKTEDDTITICSLARTCPLVGGTAVYKARSLYGLWYAPLSWDDIDLCNNAGNANRGGGGPGIFDAENAALTHMTNPAASLLKTTISRTRLREKCRFALRKIILVARKFTLNLPMLLAGKYCR